jgi:hypothetical protein
LTSLGRWVALTVLGGALPARADPACGRSGAQLDFRIGSVAAPFYSAALPEVRSPYQAYALVLGGWHRLKSGGAVGARMPIATSTIEQPAGSFTADYTIGNPELFLTLPGPPFAERQGGATALRLAVGLPLAGHGDRTSLVRNRVVAASDALEGWRDPGLYRPGRLPLVIGAEGSVQPGAWRLSARLALPFLIRVSGASLPAGSGTRRLGFLPMAELAVTWRPRPWLGMGLAGHLVVAALDPVRPPRDVGRSGNVQGGLAPFVELTGQRLGVRVDLLAAAGGPLRGTFGLGLHLRWRR